MDNSLRLKKPPIVERIIGVYSQDPAPHFEKLLAPWAEKISSDYPVPGPIAEWRIDIEEKNGVPVISSLTPKARIIHLYWRRHPKGEHIRGLRVRPDRLVFHLVREDDKPHSFAELLPEMQKWLPQWKEHFGVQRISGVSVEYINILDGNITPQFLNSKGGINIGDALEFFARFPGRYKSLSTPLDTKIRLVIDEAKPVLFDVRIRADDRSNNAVRVDFNARIFPKDRALTVPEALSELEAGHQIILEQFACFFTQKAKLSFV